VFGFMATQARKMANSARMTSSRVMVRFPLTGAASDGQADAMTAF
jgi:hypothetical protein